MHPTPLALLSLSVALVLVQAAPAQAETLEVTASALNVRSGPGTRYRVIHVARRGQRYDVLGRSGSWRQVRTAGGTGWFSANFARRVAAAATPPAAPATRTEQCVVGFVNVRSGPSTRYRVLFRLTRGQRVQVTRQTGAWKEFLTFGGGRAYAYASYLGPVSAAPTPPTTPPATPPARRRTSRAGFIQLPASGVGFVAYSISSRRWGRPALIYAMERAARQFKNEGNRARVRVGNISLQNGGRMPPHVSHRYGKDMDVAPMRTDNREAAVYRTWRTYSRAKTRRVIDLLRAQVRPRVVLFNDSRIPGVTRYPGHDNHFHFSIN